MSYTRSDAAQDTCLKIRDLLVKADTENMSQFRLVELLESIYEMANDAVEGDFPE